MTVLIAVCCPYCHSTEVVKYGQSSTGKQRYRCLNSECSRLTFSLDLAYPALKAEVKQQIIEMTCVQDKKMRVGVATGDRERVS